MGNGRWSSSDWKSTRAAYTASAKPTVDHIYKSYRLENLLDPKGVAVRESRDSAANPNSTALIVGLDVTGSMSRVLDNMAREGLGTLVGNIYERRPITDPHVMVMGIGDMQSDQAPLQVTQFEAANDALVTQMEKIWLERGGGNNNHESYAAAWYFAATHTSIDCFEKRGKRGYLFTVGDEEPTPVLRAQHLSQFIGDDVQADLTGEQALAMAQMTYDVFHVLVAEGSYARKHLDQTMTAWTRLMGQNVILLSDHTKLAEVIVSAIQVSEGADKAAVSDSWGGGTSVVVADALKNLNPNVPAVPGSGGGIKLY